MKLVLRRSAGAAREPSAERNGILLTLFPALTPSARRARLGPCWANLSSRLTALGFSRGGHLCSRFRSLKTGPDANLKHSTPAASAGVSFFRAEAARTEARQGFRAAGLHEGARSAAEGGCGPRVLRRRLALPHEFGRTTTSGYAPRVSGP